MKDIKYFTMIDSENPILTNLRSNFMKYLLRNVKLHTSESLSS